LPRPRVFSLLKVGSFEGGSAVVAAFFVSYVGIIITLHRTVMERREKGRGSVQVKGQEGLKIWAINTSVLEGVG
jgi:hypothetical protein